jgi:hypothetical protein
MSKTEFGHEELRGTSECVLEFPNDVLCVFALIFDGVYLTANIAIVKGNARRGVYHAKRWALSGAFEVSVDNGDFLGSVHIFRLKFEAEHDLLHFFINVGGSGAIFGSGGRTASSVLEGVG